MSDYTIRTGIPGQMRERLIARIGKHRYPLTVNLPSFGQQAKCIQKMIHFFKTQSKKVRVLALVLPRIRLAPYC